jgi:hypothetical protein
MRIVLICRAVTGMALLLSLQAAGAHGIAGNRFFVGTYIRRSIGRRRGHRAEFFNAALFLGRSDP